jgi:hypothetical protein
MTVTYARTVAFMAGGGRACEVPEGSSLAHSTLRGKATEATYSSVGGNTCGTRGKRVSKWTFLPSGSPWPCTTSIGHYRHLGFGFLRLTELEGNLRLKQQHGEVTKTLLYGHHSLTLSAARQQNRVLAVCACVCVCVLYWSFV